MTHLINECEVDEIHLRKNLSGHIKLLDFDGVIASPTEEAMYQLPISQRDVSFVEAASKHFGFDYNYESLKSCRYMCMQATLMAINYQICPRIPPESLSGPMMIITARSDYFALRRLFSFLEQNKIHPLFIFTVGKMQKKNIIASLLEQYINCTFEFHDDLQQHIDPTLNMSDRLQSVKIDNDMDIAYLEAEKIYSEKILNYDFSR